MPDQNTAEADSRDTQNPEILHGMPEIAGPKIFGREIELIAADVPVKCRELRQSGSNGIPKHQITPLCRKFQPIFLAMLPENGLG